MAKAAIYTANQGAQALQIGSVLSLGSIIRRFGCGVNLPLVLQELRAKAPTSGQSVPKGPTPKPEKEEQAE